MSNFGCSLAMPKQKKGLSQNSTESLTRDCREVEKMNDDMFDELLESVSDIDGGDLLV